MCTPKSARQLHSKVVMMGQMQGRYAVASDLICVVVNEPNVMHCHFLPACLLVAQETLEQLGQCRGLHWAVVAGCMTIPHLQTGLYLVGALDHTK